MIRYYSVEVIDNSFGNDYTAADGRVYKARLTDWGYIAVIPGNPNIIYFYQFPNFGQSCVRKKLIDNGDIQKYLRITAVLPVDADLLKIFCRNFGEEFVYTAGQLEKDFYNTFKIIL